MCGLFGSLVDNRITTTQASGVQRALACLAVLNTDRGEHAHGSLVIPASGEPRLARKLGAWRMPIPKLGRGLTGYLGHTRYATCDNRERTDCAHPFPFELPKGRVAYGLHNGCIWNHARLEQYPVDSQAVLSSLISSDLSELRETEGYGTCVWYERKRGLRFTRWNGGEFCLVRMPFGWIWTSSATHMKRALKIAGLSSAAKRVETMQGIEYALTASELTPVQRLPLPEGRIKRSWDSYRLSDWIDEINPRTYSGTRRRLD